MGHHDAGGQDRGDVGSRWRPGRSRRRIVGWVLLGLAVAIAVLLVALVDGRPSDELSEDVVEVPTSHPAQQLLDETATYEAFIQRASEILVVGSNVDSWACGLGGVGVCYVIAEGVVAVIAFDAPQSAVAVVTGPGIDGEVTIPLNTEQLLGVESDSTEINVSVLDALGGELIQVGSL